MLNILLFFALANCVKGLKVVNASTEYEYRKLHGLLVENGEASSMTEPQHGILTSGSESQSTLPLHDNRKSVDFKEKDSLKVHQGQEKTQNSASLRNTQEGNHVNDDISPPTFLKDQAEQEFDEDQTVSASESEVCAGKGSSFECDCCPRHTAVGSRRRCGFEHRRRGSRRRRRCRRRRATPSPPTPPPTFDEYRDLSCDMCEEMLLDGTLPLVPKWDCSAVTHSTCKCHNTFGDDDDDHWGDFNYVCDNDLTGTGYGCKCTEALEGSQSNLLHMDRPLCLTDEHCPGYNETHPDESPNYCEYWPSPVSYSCGDANGRKLPCMPKAGTIGKTRGEDGFHKCYPRGGWPCGDSGCGFFQDQRCGGRYKNGAGFEWKAKGIGEGNACQRTDDMYLEYGLPIYKASQAQCHDSWEPYEDSYMDDDDYIRALPDPTERGAYYMMINKVKGCDKNNLPIELKYEDCYKCEVFGCRACMLWRDHTGCTPQGKYYYGCVGEIQHKKSDVTNMRRAHYPCHYCHTPHSLV